MNLLLTNDDGIYAEGLETLVSALCKDHKLYIAAPTHHQSAKSHSITLFEPIFISEIDKFDHKNVIRQTAVSGTPADCVKIAIGELFKDVKFDLVISGINHGPNLGNDIIYSGTVAAAIEASFHGIPSIAASLYGRSDYDFRKAASYIKDNIDKLLGLIEDPSMILNINFPFGESYKGTKITELGRMSYINLFDQRTNPHGKKYYWIGGEPAKDLEENHENTDVTAIIDNYVTITPLSFNFSGKFKHQNQGDLL